MSKIISYDFSTVQAFMRAEESSYEEQLTQTLVFEDWKCRALPALFNNPKQFGVVPYKYGSIIKVCPTGLQMARIIEEYRKDIQEIEFKCPIEEQDLRKSELFRSILKPVREFKIDSPIYIDGKTSDGVELKVPIWFNTTLKSINLRPGFANLDSSTPACFPLSDQVVHAMAGGRTGAGKSVLLNDLIATLLLEYPPWELDLMLADFKIVELSRYGNRFPTPHVSVIAATASTEFALSVFKAMVAEMNARQEVFTAVGVTNLKEFREKFELCMPRTLLIADEFVQMYENIKISEAAGNDKADEMKKDINQSISATGRLGRSMGMHMLLSSQNMEGQLDDQTSGQFAGGITLGATPSVSTSLIGNPAGALLEGKGKAYMNLNKAGKKPEQNVLCWVPFIQDKLSEEESAQGKLSYLLNNLKICTDLARKYGWNREPFVYNEKESVSIYEFQSQKKFALEYFKNPQEGSEIRNQIYKDLTVACIPLGREVVYKENPICLLDLKRRPRNNLIVSATEELTKLYILKLLVEAFSMYPLSHHVIGVDPIISRQLDFNQINGKVTISQKAAAPQRFMNMVKTRKELLYLQSLFCDAGMNKCWDDKEAYTYCINTTPQSLTRSVNMQVVNSFVTSCNYNLISMKDMDTVTSYSKEIGIELKKEELNLISALISRLAELRNTMLIVTKDENVVLTAAMFSQIIIWWLGADQIANLCDFDSKGPIKAFFEQCCQVGIFNVVVADKWATLAPLSSGCNFILEKCSKDFFMDIELQKNININPNSFQLHNREEKTRAIIRMFSM